MKREIGANTVLAGSWSGKADDEAASNTRQKIESRRALSRTVVMPSPIALPSAKAAKAALDVTMLLRPVPKVNNATVNLARPAEPSPVTPARPTPAPLAARPVVRAFEVEILEKVTRPIRYREVMRHGDEHAMLLMTDFATTNQPIPTELLTRWQTGVRAAVIGGAGPEALLQLLNREILEAGLEGTGTCARLDVRGRRLVVASAGGPDPFVVHGSNGYVRLRPIPSAALGRIPTPRFAEQSIHFDRRDTVLIPSRTWSEPLERLFAAPIERALQTLSFALRERRAQPPGGALLRLTMR